MPEPVIENTVREPARSFEFSPPRGRLGDEWLRPPLDAGIVGHLAVRFAPIDFGAPIGWDQV